MVLSEDIKNRILSELEFSFARSSGPGGQHVNKTESKVELRFHVNGSAFLSPSDKARIIKKLKNRIAQEGWLVITAQESRSQGNNKEIAIEKFFALLSSALKRAPLRVPTKPTRSSVEKRLERKKKMATKKEARKPLTSE